jgi:hypothetical protein
MSRRRHVVAVLELLIMQRVLGYARGLRVACRWRSQTTKKGIILKFKENRK